MQEQPYPCCRQPLAIYCGPMHEGAVLHRSWDRRELVFKAGAWKQEEATGDEIGPGTRQGVLRGVRWSLEKKLIGVNPG
jgi:hypothetical protein